MFPGTQGGPLEHVIAAKAVAFGEALRPSFKVYSQQVVANAQALADRLMARGIDVVSGGTDNHVVLLDLRSIGMTGKVADLLVSDVHITANKNTVPFDPESPFVTSGLRLGTAALTTRGFDADAFAEVAEVIADRLLESPRMMQFRPVAWNVWPVSVGVFPSTRLQRSRRLSDWTMQTWIANSGLPKLDAISPLWAVLFGVLRDRCEHSSRSRCGDFPGGGSGHHGDRAARAPAWPSPRLHRCS